MVNSNTKKAIIPCVSSFSAKNGSEYFITLTSPSDIDFDLSSEAVLEAYTQALEDNELDLGSEIWLKFHINGVEGNRNILESRLNENGGERFYTILEQRPAGGGQIALEAYHMKDPSSVVKKKLTEAGLNVSHGTYSSLWTHLSPDSRKDISDQTIEVFENISKYIQGRGGGILDNLLRTWIYVSDIDKNYVDMSDIRRVWFEENGLTELTHYIASTGIGFDPAQTKDLIHMDALSVFGLTEDQVTYMDVPEYMNRTHEYNVTFERGTRIVYGDRAHYYISGTASIDKNGNILHIDDIKKQTERAFVNIQALLSSYGSDLKDMKIMTVYLRNIEDEVCVRKYLEENLPCDIPYVIVKGKVCRPQWLIEIEGIAVADVDDKRFSPFC